MKSYEYANIDFSGILTRSQGFFIAKVWLNDRRICNTFNIAESRNFLEQKFSKFSHRSCETLTLLCVTWENGRLFTQTQWHWAFPPAEGFSGEENQKLQRVKSAWEMKTREWARKKNGKTRQRQQTQNFSFFVLVSCSLLSINRKRRNYIIKLRKFFEEKRTNGGKLIISSRELIFFLFLFCALTKSAQSIEHRLSNERWCRRQWRLTAVYREVSNDDKNREGENDIKFSRGFSRTSASNSQAIIFRHFSYVFYESTLKSSSISLIFILPLSLWWCWFPRHPPTHSKCW